MNDTVYADAALRQLQTRDFANGRLHTDECNVALMNGTLKENGAALR